MADNYKKLAELIQSTWYTLEMIDQIESMPLHYSEKLIEDIKNSELLHHEFTDYNSEDFRLTRDYYTYVETLKESLSKDQTIQTRPQLLNDLNMLVDISYLQYLNISEKKNILSTNFKLVMGDDYTNFDYDYIHELVDTYVAPDEFLINSIDKKIISDRQEYLIEIIELELDYIAQDFKRLKYNPEVDMTQNEDVLNYVDSFMCHVYNIIQLNKKGYLQVIFRRIIT